MKPYLALTDNSLAAMKTFAESNGDPIVMVNLMQVRPNALYEPPLVDHCSGYEALARYTHESAAVRQAAGAGLVWSGQALQMPIGPSEKVWDVVALVRYPSAGAYLTMVATEAYKAARQHRTAALCDSRLIMTAEHASLG
ncbi:DUF1330 domain-containing protein [Luminiphilus sp.]|nr:DUF1330 domain-containing protein [Luminiphilus sp.]MDB2644891.1 DUF1330 domain-containing protein [Luminiphilus sp.]MDB4049331.1 DUF1330 domain-containing protein [Luminiphilus sp.]